MLALQRPSQAKRWRSRVWTRPRPRHSQLSVKRPALSTVQPRVVRINARRSRHTSHALLSSKRASDDRLLPTEPLQNRPPSHPAFPEHTRLSFIAVCCPGRRVADPAVAHGSFNLQSLHLRAGCEKKSRGIPPPFLRLTHRFCSYSGRGARQVF